MTFRDGAVHEEKIAGNYGRQRVRYEQKSVVLKSM